MKKCDFLDRFPDGRDKFKQRIGVENASGKERELVINYVHRVNQADDRG